MNYRIALLTTVTLASFTLPSIAAAQSAKDIVGTWMLIAAETTMPDGKKTPSFGAKPTGMLVFTEDGRDETPLGGPSVMLVQDQPRC